MKNDLKHVLQKYRAGTDTESDRQIIESALETGMISLEDIPGFKETQGMVDKALLRDLRMPAHQFPGFLTDKSGMQKKTHLKTQMLAGILKVAAILAVGILAGYLIRGAQVTDLKADRIQAEQAEIRAMFTDQSIALERLKLVRQVAQNVEMGETEIYKLYYSMVSDPNINVRFGALAALESHMANPRVVQTLLNSIPVQNAPLVQLRLAEMMLSAGETKAVEPLLNWIQSSGMEGQFREDFLYIINQIRKGSLNI